VANSTQARPEEGSTGEQQQQATREARVLWRTGRRTELDCDSKPLTMPGPARVWKGEVGWERAERIGGGRSEDTEAAEGHEERGGGLRRRDRGAARAEMEVVVE
jgi:hypothetical protein